MAVPTTTLRVDWENKGTFDGPFDTVTALIGPGDQIALSRGASANLLGEASGELRFDLDNLNDAYTLDRNWADNPSFEAGTTGWETYAIDGLTAAATSITQVTDNATGAGTKAGEAVLTATSGSGVFYRIPYPFKDGVTYSFSISVKSASGTLNVRCGLASSGTPSDIGTSGSNITTNWAAYTGTFTPSADRNDVVVWVRTNTASAATVRIDAVQVNPGSAANTYLEAPTRGMLLGNRPVHFYATWGGDDTAKFYGYISRISPDPMGQRVAVVCKDMLARMDKAEVIVPANDYAAHSARTMRLAVLSDFERGNRNLVGHNASFEVDTVGWTQSGVSLTRVTNDAAPGGGTCSADFEASAGAQRAYINGYLAPIFLPGETYRGSFYARVASGTETWIIGLGPVGASNTRSITVTEDWQRFTITYQFPEDEIAREQSIGIYLPIYIESNVAGTVRIDNVAITRGPALQPYAATGTGRWGNWCGNGDFEGLSGTEAWVYDWTNLITNGSFEVNTTGWSGASDAFVGTSTVSRVASDPAYGTAHGSIVIAAPSGGTFYAITGTFLSGVVYDVGMLVKCATGGTITVGIGSQGTPADTVTTSNTGTGSYALYTVPWTPSSNRTDAHLYMRHSAGATVQIDGAFVYRRPSSGAFTSYSDTGPGGGGVAPTSINVTLNGGKYGYVSLSVDTPATANSGVQYDFSHVGPVFVSGQEYILSLWVYPDSSMDYEVGLGVNKGDGTWDEATTTGTAAQNVWTQITRTWTPSANRDTNVHLEGVIFIRQTDATARNFRVDGVRVIPGGTADDFEMGHWDVDVNGAGEAGDQYLATAALEGSALSALGELNELTLTRHWIRPEMTDPFYAYVTEDRVSFLTKSSVATYTETVDGWQDLDVDEEDVINVVAVSWDDGQDIYSDSRSVGEFGDQPGADIDGGDFFPDRTIPDLVGPALVDRYKDPRPRPTLTVTNEFTKMLATDLNDVITVTIDRFRVRSVQYVVLREDLSITNGGRDWTAQYRLEEYPY